ncbi:TIGR03086 family metal-binding protein [Actinophytocola oryzae]|uniref:Uncharacterized protein (TIGR03086 family) n=1 Tax=Actinophytocola oryzae TaxID=502181 RepID=A0A4R7VQR7_9PSEU|nr:TIGR03086 family metal-binding protein [Actinophytocola oryzae]TDV52103.1 uncharacterized protein (TIGR03086 family) [Actinophytocola oryzae]
MQNILTTHRQAIDAVLEIVGAVRAEGLGRPTPCTGWTLRDLIAHMAGQDVGFGVAALTDVGDDAFVPRDVGRYRGGANLVVAAFAAADPERSVLLPEFHRRFPLPTVVGFHLLDTLVHGWDVAVSVGLDVGYDDELVAAALVQAENVPGGDARTVAGAAFGPVLDGADASHGWARTLRLLGRDPAWAAATAER